MTKLSGRRERVEVTVDKVQRSRGKMMQNKAHGPEDCLVSEMLRELPIETAKLLILSVHGSGLVNQGGPKSSYWGVLVA